MRLRVWRAGLSCPSHPMPNVSRMKTKTPLLARVACAATLLVLASAASAQSLVEELKSLYKRSEVFPVGTAYFEADNGERYAIPFATFSFYDHDDSDRLVYLIMADRFGAYTVRNYDYKKSYVCIVEAPGFAQGNYEVRPLSTTHPDGRPLKGNTDIHFKLEKISEGGSPYSLKTYKVDDLKRKADAGDLMELLGSIPGLRHEDGGLTTSDGGAVRLKANDDEIPSGLLKYMNALPLMALTEIEVYTLPGGGPFDAVVNLLVVGGKRTPKRERFYKVWEGGI